MTRSIVIMTVCAGLLACNGGDDKGKPDKNDTDTTDTDTTDTDTTDTDTTDTDTTPDPVDADGDGFNEDDDCDDSDGTVYPGAVELCDHIDNDCDAQTPIDFDAWIPDDFATVADAAASNVDAIVCVETGTWDAQGIQPQAELYLLGRGIGETFLDGGNEQMFESDFALGMGSMTILNAGHDGIDSDLAGLAELTADFTIEDVLIDHPVQAGWHGYLVAAVEADIYVRDVEIDSPDIHAASHWYGFFYTYDGALDVDGLDIHDGTFVSDTDIYGTLYHHLGPVDIANVSVRYSTFTALSLFGALFCEEESVDTSTLSGLELIGNSFDVVEFYGALSLDELDTDVNVENIEILGNSLVTDLTYGWLGYWTHTYGSGRWDNLLIAGNHQQAAVDPAPVIDEITGTNSGSNWTIAYNTNSAPAGVGLIVLPDDWTLRNLDITSNDSDPGEALLSGFGTIDADYVNSFDSDANGVIDDGNGTSTPAHYAQSDPAYVYSEDDAVDWDLHPDVGSPLIDAGDPAILDADGSTRRWSS